MNNRPADEKKETGRIEAFSDGVLAIVITLLALELKVPTPEGNGPGLLQALIHQWPVYLAFLVSFFFILVIWINHHRLFTAIRRSDNNLLLLNGLLLLTITLIPFGTALVAEYLQSADQNVAAMVYSGIFFVNALLFNALWRYASYKDRLFDANTDLRLAAFITRQYSFGPLFYVVAFVLAMFSALLCLLWSLALAIFFVIPNRTTPELVPEGDNPEVL
jgi:uncharacterized membrane protein